KGKYEPAYVPATVNQSVQMDAVGLYSDTYIETGDYNYYLIAANDWRMATLKLMKQAGDIASVMPIFPPSTDRQETAIRQAIIEHCKSDEAHRNFCAESHRVYHVERTYDAQGNLSGWTAYLLVNYAEERLVNGFYTNQWGRLSPIALTFKTDIVGNHALTEFWEPRDGSEYEPSIRDKFPFEYQEDALRMEGRTELSRRVKQALKKKRKADEKGWSHE
ncbi:MAG: hypothetical protein IIU77_03810, partial [Clostridia bacterium]|nr:hypothetical protein [Clostridia bacterium]